MNYLSGQTGINSERDIYTITRLNREARAVLEGSFPAIWVQGEISNLARPASGHLYFSLKDQSSQVRCAMFKSQNRSLRFAPENGMQVLARAKITLYEGRGDFQLVVELLEPAGAGALQRAFEVLKQRLNAEGLFDAARKRELPRYPRTIGVITSPSGAAIRDILTVLKRRYPAAGVIIYPVPVQGEGAGAVIAAMLRHADARREADVIILSRGGGSLEDLWAFNDEGLARAIHACTIPVVSGIGHEIDFTIADFVADQRAATPSAAAELVSPNGAELQERLLSMQGKLHTHIRHLLRHAHQHLAQLAQRLPHPQRRLQQIAQRLDEIALRARQAIRTRLLLNHSRLSRLSAQVSRHNPQQRLQLHRERFAFLAQRMQQRMQQNLHEGNSRFQRLARALHTVSPLATLERGYAIVNVDGSEQVVRDAATLSVDQSVHTRFARGSIESTITKVNDE